MVTASYFPITMVTIAAVAAFIFVYAALADRSGTTYSQKTAEANHLKVDLPGKINQPTTAEKIPLSNHIDPTPGAGNSKSQSDIGKSLISPAGKTTTGNMGSEKGTWRNGNTTISSNYLGKHGEKSWQKYRTEGGLRPMPPRFVVQLAARRDQQYRSQLTPSIVKEESPSIPV